jgi:hypothetical protein
VPVQGLVILRSRSRSKRRGVSSSVSGAVTARSERRRTTISAVLGDRFVRNFDPTFEPKGMVGVRRLEVITGVGGRRAWSHEDKGRIVAESFAAGANVSAVARRYGLRPQQVYAWDGWPAAVRWRCRRQRRWGLCRSSPRRANRRCR